MKLVCGIDWAEGHHDLAVIDAEGQLVAKKRIADDPAGFAELIEVLTAAGDSVEDVVPVAIETPRGLLVAALRATGRPVYAINPLAVARYWERLSVAVEVRSRRCDDPGAHPARGCPSAPSPPCR